MIWNAKQKKSPPKLGDKKEKIKFALFPCRVQDKWIWLENFIGIYEYKTVYTMVDEVVKSGILFESYRRVPYSYDTWEQIDRKLIQ